MPDTHETTDGGEQVGKPAPPSVPVVDLTAELDALSQCVESLAVATVALAAVRTHLKHLRAVLAGEA